MNPSAWPMNAPVWIQWLGWTIAAVLFVYYKWVAPHRLAASANARADTKHEFDLEEREFDLQKQKQLLLREEIDALSGQFATLSGAWNADDVVSADDLERLNALPNASTSDKVVAAHVSARREVRKELSLIIERVRHIKEREAALRAQLLATGAPLVDDPQLVAIRDDLDAVVRRVFEMLRHLIDSPRIYVQEDEPPVTPGAIWIHLPPG